MSVKFHDSDVPDELPPDLAALGGQLQADANYLGKTFPPCHAPVALMEALEKNSHWQRRLRVLILASSAAAAFLLIAISLQWAMPGVVGWQKPAAEAAAHAADPTEQDFASSHSPVVQPVSLAPALADVNGPELEGLLDLLDEHGQTAASISF